MFVIVRVHVVVVSLERPKVESDIVHPEHSWFLLRVKSWDVCLI